MPGESAYLHADFQLFDLMSFTDLAAVRMLWKVRAGDQPLMLVCEHQTNEIRRLKQDCMFLIIEGEPVTSARGSASSLLLAL